jgi:hypothetical protein
LFFIGVVHGDDVSWNRLARYFLKGFMEGHQVFSTSSLPAMPLF